MNKEVDRWTEQTHNKLDKHTKIREGMDEGQKYVITLNMKSARIHLLNYQSCIHTQPFSGQNLPFLALALYTNLASVSLFSKWGKLSSKWLTVYILQWLVWLQRGNAEFHRYCYYSLDMTVVVHSSGDPCWYFGKPGLTSKERKVKVNNHWKDLIN